MALNGSAHYLSISSISRQIALGEVSPVEVTEMQLARIAQLNPGLQAYVPVAGDSALAAAKDAEREIASGQWRGPLHGVPLAVKDLCLTRDARTRFGTMAYDYAPQADEATAVRRLRQAGAVILGKLTMTEAATLYHHPDCPTPINPWDGRFWTGASSSGSGVASAAGLCFGALGSDTAGSIRNPSLCCGLTGLKPSWGRVSRHGVLALAESLDHLGPMARSVEDVAMLLGAIAGPDPLDPTALRAPVPNYLRALENGIGLLRIGIDPDYAMVGVEPSVLAAVKSVTETLSALGGRTVDCKVPDWQDAVRNGVTILNAEVGEIHQERYTLNSKDFSAALGAMINVGQETAAADLLRAQRAALAFSRRMIALFEDIDVLVLPVLPVRVPSLHQVEGFADDFAEAVNLLARFSLPFNVAGLPSLVLPCGVDENGLPIAAQLIGPPLSEDRLLAVGHAFQAVTPWHTRHPNC